MRKWFLGPALALLLGLGSAVSPARADLIISVQEDAGPIQSFTVTGTPGNFSSNVPNTVTTADYEIDNLVGREKQLPNNAQLTSATASISNETGSSGHVLHITVSGTLFSAPTTPPPVMAFSHIGGTVSQGSALNSLVYHSIVAGDDLGAQSPSITTSNSSYQSDKSILIVSGVNNPFEIDETFDIKLNGLNDAFNFSASTQLQPTPEPATMTLALVALPIIGWGIRRSRQAKA